MESTEKQKGADVSEFNTEGVIDSMMTYYEVSSLFVLNEGGKVADKFPNDR